MKHLNSLLLVALALVTFTIGDAWSQSRVETTDASTAVAVELHCARNADATWDCYSVARVDTSTDTGAGIVTSWRTFTGRARTLRAANTNRVQTVADALLPQALRSNGFDGVDAGSP